MEKLVNYLLAEGCPSIQYRVKKEIYNEIDYNLYEKILDDREVRKIIDRQDHSGWINEDFHSEKGVETAGRVFFEKGLENDYPPYMKMLNELEKRNDTFDNGCLFNVGKVLDRKGFGGSELMRAVIFAYAGLENKALVKKQIEETLNCFRYLNTVHSLEQITEPYRNKLVFTERAKWPSIYHLRLLAYTKSWRNKNNHNMIVNSIKKLIQFSPIPHINVLENNQLISAASFCMHDFNPNLFKMDDKEWMMWFHRMELLSRLGVVDKIIELKKQVGILIRFVKESNGLFYKKMNHYYFTKWGTYTGLALEKDWRSSKRRVSDLSFRSLLILHYSGIDWNRNVDHD